MSSGGQQQDPRKGGGGPGQLHTATATGQLHTAVVTSAAGTSDQQQQQQQPQDFDSWRHPQQHQTAPPGYNLASDLYGFYQQNPFHHYTGFGVSGDAGTWSNGDHMTFLSGYGTQLPGTEPQFGIEPATMFGAGAAGGFGAFTQPAGYGFDFTGSGSAVGYSQWGGGRAATGEQQWGRAGEQQYYRQEHYTQEGRSRVAAAEQAMQGLHIGANHTQDTKEGKTDGKEGGGKQAPPVADSSAAAHPTLHPPSGQPKKMSWASVASQPAKPPSTVKPKKPGVLSPPQLPSKPSVEIGTWDTATVQQNGNAVPPLPLGGGAPHPTATSLMGVPPPISISQQGAVSMSMGGGGAPPHHPIQTSRGGIMSTAQPPPSAGVSMGRGAWMGGRGGAHLASAPVPVMSNGVTPPGGGMHPPPGPPPTAAPAAAAQTTGPCNVLDELKSSNNYNPREFDMNPQGARFFVVKSYSEDDIHRSIKYEVWCSTEHGNKRLDGAFREREGKGPVYLFFSVNGSGHFCGMAQMLTQVDYSSSAKVWAQDKWKGQFKVKWIYVKDVPNQQLRHIKLENNENKPVTNSRDTQEVPPEKGRQVLKILHLFKHNTSIFDDFSHYEKRQEEEEGRKPHQNGRSDRRDDGREYHGGSGRGRGHYESRGGGRKYPGPPPQRGGYQNHHSDKESTNGNK